MTAQGFLDEKKGKEKFHGLSRENKVNEPLSKFYP